MIITIEFLKEMEMFPARTYFDEAEVIYVVGVDTSKKTYDKLVVDSNGQFVYDGVEPLTETIEYCEGKLVAIDTEEELIL